METPATIAAKVWRRILVPGVTGTALQIGRPFGPRRALLAAKCGDDELHEGQADAPDAALGEVRGLLGAGALDAGEAAVVRRIQRLVPVDASAIGARIDASVLRLGALLHDAVAAYHPDMAGVFRPNAPRKLLAATIAALGEVAPPATVRGALLRHAWLGELLHFSLARVDVGWWTGSARFIGRTPPPRLMAWPGVRRVRRDERTIALMRLPDLFEGMSRGEVEPALAEAYRRAITLFLHATPLTDLVLAGRETPAFEWAEPHARLVAKPAGARLVRRAIALGDDRGKPAYEAITAACGSLPEALRSESGVSSPS